MGARVGEPDEDVDSDEGRTKNNIEVGGNIEDERIVENLLGIRGNCIFPYMQQQDDKFENMNLQSHHSAHMIGVSITKLFEPKFLEIYNAYKDHICNGLGSSDIDLSQHLMSLCLDHLVPFSCWARESTSRCIWIQKTLDDNIDLRPEVRNGLCMVFVYAFSAAKALETTETDMFLVLQEPETGLGIVNKTSLKIYNDPFCYFSFLKACMSGLIDAGKLPENERLNQPKKPRRQVELGEELGAFVQMRAGLVLLFNRGDNDIVREKVRQILAVWQYRAKSIRNRRFATALSVMSNLKASPFLVPDLMTMGPPLGNNSGFNSLGNTESASQNTNYNRKGDHRTNVDNSMRHGGFDNTTESRNSYAFPDFKKSMSPHSNQNNQHTGSNSSSSGHRSNTGSVTENGTGPGSSVLHSLMNLSSAASNLKPYDGTYPHSNRSKLNLHVPMESYTQPTQTSISSIYNSSKEPSTASQVSRSHSADSRQGCGSGSGSCGRPGVRSSNCGPDPNGNDKSSRSYNNSNNISNDSSNCMGGSIISSNSNNDYNHSHTYNKNNINENKNNNYSNIPKDDSRNDKSNSGCQGNKNLKRPHSDLDDVVPPSPPLGSGSRITSSPHQTSHKALPVGKDNNVGKVYSVVKKECNRSEKEKMDEKTEEVFRSCRCPGPDMNESETATGINGEDENVQIMTKSSGCGGSRNKNAHSSCSNSGNSNSNDNDKNRNGDSNRIDDQYNNNGNVLKTNNSSLDIFENGNSYQDLGSRSGSRLDSDSDQSSTSTPRNLEIVNLCSSPSYSNHESEFGLSNTINGNSNDDNIYISNGMVTDQNQIPSPRDSNLPNLPSLSAIPISSTIPRVSLPLRGIKSIRFERMSATEWEMKENRIFNIDSLLNDTGFVVHLVNESKFSQEEMREMLLVARSTGFINLQSELQQRRALIASWPITEHSSLIDFINEWRRDENADLSLVNFWNSSANKIPDPTKRLVKDGSNTSTLSVSDPRGDLLKSGEYSDVITQGTGVVVYEVVMKIGFIVRANKSLNIPDDCWRVIYPRELHSTSLQAPFATFLCDFFPQLRSVLSKLDNLQDCVVKYCPHSATNEKLSQPPCMLGSSYYQTIGTMTDTAANMIGRLEANHTIYDFVLQL